MRGAYIVVSGLLFVVIAIVQAVRAFNQWPIHIGTTEIPVNASWVAALVFAALAFWAFRSRA
jgi:hypothetical protein